MCAFFNCNGTFGAWLVPLTPHICIDITGNFPQLKVSTETAVVDKDQCCMLLLFE